MSTQILNLFGKSALLAFWRVLCLLLLNNKPLHSPFACIVFFLHKKKYGAFPNVYLNNVKIKAMKNDQERKEYPCTIGAPQGSPCSFYLRKLLESCLHFGPILVAVRLYSLMSLCFPIPMTLKTSHCQKETSWIVLNFESEFIGFRLFSVLARNRLFNSNPLVFKGQSIGIAFYLFSHSFVFRL